MPNSNNNQNNLRMYVNDVEVIPSGIYLGLNTDKKYKSEIIHFAKNKHIPIYQMKQKGNEYKLIPELIEIKEYV